MPIYHRKAGKSMLTILKHFLLTGIDGRKAIRRIAQPQPEGLRSSGLGAAPQQAEKPFVLWKRNGWFFAFVLQMHCLLLLYQIWYKSSYTKKSVIPKMRKSALTTGLFPQKFGITDFEKRLKTHGQQIRQENFWYNI